MVFVLVMVASSLLALSPMAARGSTSISRSSRSFIAIILACVGVGEIWLLRVLQVPAISACLPRYLKPLFSSNFALKEQRCVLPAGQPGPQIGLRQTTRCLELCHSRSRGACEEFFSSILRNTNGRLKIVSEEKGEKSQRHTISSGAWYSSWLEINGDVTRI